MNRPLTSIAFVTETFPPEIGGAAMCAARLLDALSDHGINVRLYRPAGNGGVLKRFGLRDFHLPGFAIPLHPGLRLGWPCRKRLRADWERFPPDLVHIVTEGPLGASALRAARSLGLPTTSGFHTNFHSYSRHYGLGRLAGAGLAYLRLFHNATGGTMVPTPQIEAHLRGEGFERLRIVGRGVDAAAFNPEHRSEGLRARWGAMPSDPVALYVGRLAPEKNATLAFSAFREARERIPRARLVVVGDGPLKSELERMNPGAIFTGALRGVSLSEHYASADFFLFPSLTETFGNVTLEAMASSLPVVAFNDGAARLHVDHLENGILVPLGNEEAFRAGVVLLAMNLDLAQTLGAAAVRRARQASWATVGASFVDFLSAACSAGRGAGGMRPVPGKAIAPGSGL